MESSNWQINAKELTMEVKKSKNLTLKKIQKYFLIDENFLKKIFWNNVDINNWSITWEQLKKVWLWFLIDIIIYNRELKNLERIKKEAGLNSTWNLWENDFIIKKSKNREVDMFNVFKKNSINEIFLLTELIWIPYIEIINYKKVRWWFICQTKNRESIYVKESLWNISWFQVLWTNWWMWVNTWESLEFCNIWEIDSEPLNYEIIWSEIKLYKNFNHIQSLRWTYLEAYNWWKNLVVFNNDTIIFFEWDWSKYIEIKNKSINVWKLWWFKQMKVDNNWNFLNLILEKNWLCTLYILSIKDLQIINFIDWVCEIYEINWINNIIWIRKNYHDDEIEINTNFDDFESWFDWKIVISWLNKILERTSWKISLVIWDSVVDTDKIRKFDEEKINLLRNFKITDNNWWEITFWEILDNTDEKDRLSVKKCLQIIEKIKETSLWNLIIDLLSDIEKKLNKIILTFELNDIYEELAQLKNKINSNNSYIQLKEYLQQIEKLIKTRTKISLPTTEQDAELDIIYSSINKLLEEKSIWRNEELLQKIDEYFVEIWNQLNTYRYLSQLQLIYDSVEYRRVIVLIEDLDGDIKNIKRQELKDIITKVENKLKEIQANIEQQKRKELEQKVLEIRSMFKEIEKILTNCESEEKVESTIKENPFILLIKEKIQTLDNDYSTILFEELDKIISKRLSELNVLWLKIESWFVDLWDWVKVEIFNWDWYNILDWEIKAYKDWDDLNIYFSTKDWLRKIEPSLQKNYREKKPFWVSKKDFAKLMNYVKLWNSKYKKEYYWLLKKLKEMKTSLWEWYEENDNYKTLKSQIDDLGEKVYLARIFHKLPKRIKRKIPQIRPNTIVWPTTLKFLREIWLNSNQILKTNSSWAWMILVESEAGTWKNFKIDIFAALTRRQVFEFSCNAQTQREDLMFSFELWKEWTYRLPSEFIKWIQTPWAIIVLDEINCLPPWVSKILNPLLDWRWYINDPQLWRIQKHPSVIVIWLQNPSNYIWTQKTPQEIISRSIKIKDAYPNEQLEDWTINYEEALLYARYIEWPISKLSHKKFIEMRNIIINWKSWKIDLKCDKIMRNLLKFIKFINILRKIYWNTMLWNWVWDCKYISDKSIDFNFVFSLREWIQTMTKFNYNWWNFKQAIIDVIEPKLSTNEEKIAFYEILNHSDFTFEI